VTGPSRGNRADGELPQRDERDRGDGRTRADAHSTARASARTPAHPHPVGSRRSLLYLGAHWTWRRPRQPAPGL